MADQVSSARVAKAVEFEERARGLLEAKRTKANQSLLDRKQRAYSWLAKAYRIVASEDIEGRFIYSWLALNALFGVPLNCLECVRPIAEGNDRVARQPHRRSSVSRGAENSPTQGRTDLKWFIKTLCDRDLDGRIRDLLERYWDTIDKTVDDLFLMKDYWDLQPEESLKQRRRRDKEGVQAARRHHETGRILDIVLVHRLRTLRNQLIHGAATDRLSKRRERSDAAFRNQAELLEEVVEGFLYLIEAEGERVDWPCIPAPRYESVAHRREVDACPLRHTQLNT